MSPFVSNFDVIVIGGGHAGAEAAFAAANLGASVALVTIQVEAIGRMSCNPAIGGLGKGQMVREIDALGGLMGLAIDAAGIQFRLLNQSKGPAVWAPRAQADRDLYPEKVRHILQQCPNVTFVEGLVDEILVSAVPPDHRPALNRVTGIRLADGRELSASGVVVTTGTFMRALMHCGPRKTPGGRVGEAAAEGISASLQSLGLYLERLKTGTPPRVHRDSVDYDRCEPQPGDEEPVPFSYITNHIAQKQIECWITYTHEGSHELIRDNLHRAPMFSGQIESRGPRYCPSIEDKVVRFADKSRHQLFLEPEGYDNERVYCNGISTSLPQDVQDELVHSIAGLEKAEILQYGYAVEYDFVPTHQIGASLETKKVAGLFLAGQINGTSGYEEAAGQGLIAGVNAVQMLRCEDPLVLGRDQAYIGVMIDDLVTRPPTEPYRMFTSRAEYRLHLRSDNADQRLTPIARKLGLVNDARWDVYQKKQSQVIELERVLKQEKMDGKSIFEMMRRPDFSVKTELHRLGMAERFDKRAVEQLAISVKYEGYVERQHRQIEKFKKLESRTIPLNIDYATIPDLRSEAREKWSALNPRNLGQAARISGISPSDVTVLWVHLEAKRRRKTA
jgi:tRNA uridine 5-carboxymethylaminomethyl modification enzyme